MTDLPDIVSYATVSIVNVKADVRPANYAVIT